MLSAEKSKKLLMQKLNGLLQPLDHAITLQLEADLKSLDALIEELEEILDVKRSVDTWQKLKETGVCFDTQLDPPCNA
jgi:hypothetical protein